MAAMTAITRDDGDSKAAMTAIPVAV